MEKDLPAKGKLEMSESGTTVKKTYHTFCYHRLETERYLDLIEEQHKESVKQAMDKHNRITREEIEDFGELLMDDNYKEYRSDLFALMEIRKEQDDAAAAVL